MWVRRVGFQVAPLLVLALAGTACQTAQRPVSLLPYQSNAPGIGRRPEPVAVTQLPQEQVPETDHVAELIVLVQKDYQAGEANFQAGRLEAARLNLARAYDLLTKGPFNVNSDPRLQQQLDLVVAAMKNVQRQDEEQEEASTEQESEPAPIDEANEVTPPVDLQVKAKAEAEVKATKSDLPLMMTDQVAGYINYFSGRGQDTLERALVRSGRYQEMIRKTLQEEGVPQDLIYLAQAESGFHPPGSVPRWGARDVAVHGRTRRRLRSTAQQVGG